MLPPEVQTTLTQLLQALSSGDNALRSQAEEQLNNDWTANRPDILLMGLVEQIQGGQDAAVCLLMCQLSPRLIFSQTRSFSAVLLRRIASKNRKDPNAADSKELFLCLGENERNFIRQRLLQCLASEQMANVRHKIGDAVAEIARQYTDYGTLEFLLPFTFLGAGTLRYSQDKAGPSYLGLSSRLASPLILFKERVHSEYLLQLQG